MPISPVLAEKWDRRLYNWLLWVWSGGGEGSAGGRISSIYAGEIGGRGRGGYRTFGAAQVIASGEAMDTDALMLEVRRRSEGVYDALVAWTINDGERGAQAGRLGIHRSTYYDRVDAGKQMLEQLEREKFHKRRRA